MRPTFCTDNFIVKVKSGVVMQFKRLLWIFIFVPFINGWAQSSDGIVYVKVKQENIRNRPGGEKIGELVAGTPVEILEKRPNWVKVQVTAWIWEKSLTPDSTYVEGFSIRASHILVSTEAEAQRILEELKKGIPFEELAKKYSQDTPTALRGGDLGEFKRGDFVDEFEKVAFALKPGETSRIVKTNLGYHIIKRTK